jgi:hypothetical protein
MVISTDAKELDGTPNRWLNRLELDPLVLLCMRASLRACAVSANASI